MNHENIDYPYIVYGNSMENKLEHSYSIIIMDQNTFMNFPTNKTIRKIFKSRNCYQTRVQVQKSSNLEQICKLQQIRDLLAKLSKLKVLGMVWWKQRGGGGEEKHVSLCCKIVFFTFFVFFG